MIQMKVDKQGNLCYTNYSEVKKDMETYECICEECGKVFDSTEERATLCPECWQEIVSGEGKGND